MALGGCRPGYATCSTACGRLPTVCPARTTRGRWNWKRRKGALRKARTKALVRHARAVDAIFDMQERGGKASPAQVKELQGACKVFEQVRPYGAKQKAL
jgi:hypothetical protein